MLALECIMFFSVYEHERRVLTTYDTFNLVMKILIDSFKIKDEDLTFASIAALGNFASDKGH